MVGVEEGGREREREKEGASCSYKSLLIFKKKKRVKNRGEKKGTFN
jgi:hypothetical protein